jgi:hypothetical protein
MAAPETIAMRTRDGVRLDADIYRPAGPGPHPVLLLRQPYGRRIASTVVFAHPAWYAEQGFLVVVQDVRGTGSSEGGFLPYAAEAEDGFDAIAWAAALPGSSGAVGMYGFSYQGAAQTLALSQSPPALRAISPGMALWDLHAERVSVQGAFQLAGNAYWAAQMGAVVARRAGDVAAHAELTAAANGGMRFDEAVPADPSVLRRHAGLNHYAVWHGAPADDPYFTRASSARLIGAARPAVPALFTGGWFDYHLTGTVAAFRALGGHLVIGPWTHLGWTARGAGADFGPAAEGDMDRMQVGFFAHALRGEDVPGWMRGGRVRLFDLGRRDWRVFDAWPDGTREVLHLGGDGLSATRANSGTLTPDTPAPGWERFVHDPWRPVPAFGLAHAAGQGWSDRAALDARFDLCCFTGAPAERPMGYAGEPSVLLHIETDAEAFDVSATLSLVTRDGRVMALSQGHARVMAGGSPSGGLRVGMRPLCVTLQPGERLRLSVAGACFPAFPVNPGTGTDPRFATGAEAVPIGYAIRCGTGVSRLEMPLA